jgi:hypothetical protein
MSHNEFDYLFNDTNMLIEASKDYANSKEIDNSYFKLISSFIYSEGNDKVYKDLNEDEILHISNENLAFAFARILFDFSVKKESCCLYGEKNGQAIYNKLVDILGKFSKENNIEAVHRDIGIFINNNIQKSG